MALFYCVCLPEDCLTFLQKLIRNVFDILKVKSQWGEHFQPVAGYFDPLINRYYSDVEAYHQSGAHWADVDWNLDINLFDILTVKDNYGAYP